MAIEDIYEKIGGFSNFQTVMITWMYSIKFGICWSMIMMSFAGFTPEWACLTDTDQNSLYTAAEVNNISVIKQCSVNGTKCEGYYFFGTTKTIMSEWSLVCELQIFKATITSVQMGGVMLGSILGGQSGDYFGRKKTIYGSYLVNAVLNVITAFSNSWQMFAVLRFFIGVQVGIVLVMVVPYPTEFFPLRWRHTIPAFPMWPLGAVTFAGVAWLLEDWANLHFAAAAIAVPCLLGYFYFPESARWLATKGRTEEALAALQKMATLNKQELPPSTMDTIKEIAEVEKLWKEGGDYTFIDLFKGKQLVILTFSVAFKWFVLSVISYGLVFAVNSLSGNLYLNMFLMSVVSLPGYLLSFLLIDRIGRRWTCQLFLLTAVVVSFTCVALIQIELEDDYKAKIISACCLTANLAVTACWSTSQTWVTESYPTVTRSLGYGFANMAARIGGVLCPFMINLDKQPLLTFILMGSLSLASMVVTHFIPETRNKIMAETVATEITGSDPTHIKKTNKASEEDKPPTSSLDDDPSSLHHSKQTSGNCGNGAITGIVNNVFLVERF